MFGLTKAIRELTRAVRDLSDGHVSSDDRQAIDRVLLDGEFLTRRMEKLAKAIKVLDEQTKE